MFNKKQYLLISIVLFCAYFMTSPAFSLESVYLANNIHYQAKNSNANWASYANYTDPGAGHHLLPVNTKVSIGIKTTFKGRGILITVHEDGKKIHMEYNKRNMNMSMDEYIKTITSPEKISLKKISTIDKKGIKEGKAYVGMTKDGVRMALGFPAQHKTPSLEDNAWTYWRNRFKTTVISFDGKGKVSSIR